MVLLSVLFVALAIPIPTLAQSSLPDPASTPGVINPDVTEANIEQTICVRGWTAVVRPPRGYTEALKRQQIRDGGFRDDRLSRYEEDHLLSGVARSDTKQDPLLLWV
jgi:hypothetical protein